MTAARAERVAVVVAAGGTGGHIFPGIATAEEIMRLVPDAEITFVGVGRPVEARALGRRPFGYEVIPAPRLERSWHPRNALVPFRLAAAGARAARLLRRLRARLVIGTGGYGSAPLVAAAWRARIPRMILEQNVIPGLTNRLLSRVADVACLTFEPARAWLAPRARVVVTGNPIRRVGDVGDAAGARRRLGLAAAPFTVFVFGGSQGARTLVAAAREALAALAARDVQFIVQTGDAAAWETPEAWEGRVVARPFFDEIYDCYRAADLVVCRAGGGVAEVLAFGKPMVLVPYPFAAGAHQMRNATYLEQEGAALVVADADFDGLTLAALVFELERDGGRRAAMARLSRELGRPAAAARVAREALALAGVTL